MGGGYGQESELASAELYDPGTNSWSSAASLAERREEAKLYRDLATLRLDVPLAESLDQLKWKGVRNPAYQELCSELGITGLSVPKPPGSGPN